jgi:hypothetical protein
MIDPINSLAFSIQANRGVFAVLLGSGVSRSAKIPTGWEVTLDLVRKLAEISGEPCEPSPEEWYLQKYGREPDYSEILAAIAKTPAERQQLLRNYWEPTDQEREEGAKQPTPAHRAIAALAEQGFVKVIITTNFDRLMEIALADVGITPTVLSTPDQVHGAVPLIHTRCCVFKVHGDYLDTRISNTPEELAIYPAEFDSLLDRIFDEFGLIICGWSSDWDESLRNALLRAPSRRFATYWAVRGEPSGTAQQLITHRGAQVIQIDGADQFFQAVHQQVMSLEEFSRPHPLSTEAAVASLKRYLSEPRYRIQLADLVNNEVERVVKAIGDRKFAIQGAAQPTNASATTRIRNYEAACTTLLAMAPIGGYWAESEHFQIWQRALEQLSSAPGQAGSGLWIEMQRYPATLLLYALGMGAVEAGQLNLLGKLFGTTIHREYKRDIAAVQLLPPFCLFGTAGNGGKFLEGMEKNYFPLSDWLHGFLRQTLKSMIPNNERYTLTFDKLELLLALGFAKHENEAQESYWVPMGAFGYRRDNRERILKEIEGSISRDGEKSEYLLSGILGDTTEACLKELALLSDFVKKAGRSWGY